MLNKSRACLLPVIVFSCSLLQSSALQALDNTIATSGMLATIPDTKPPSETKATSQRQFISGTGHANVHRTDWITRDHVVVTTAQIKDCLLRSHVIKYSASSGIIEIENLWINKSSSFLAEKHGCIVAILSTGRFVSINISNIRCTNAETYFSYTVTQNDKDLPIDMFSSRSCIRLRTDNLTLHLSPTNVFFFGVYASKFIYSVEPLSLTVSFFSLSRRVLQVNMISPMKGSVSTPNWDGITPTVFMTRMWANLTVPTDHHVMISMFHIDLRKPEFRLQHALDPKQSTFECLRTSFVGLYADPATDPLKVFCGTLTSGPSAFAPRSGLLYILFVNSVQTEYFSAFERAFLTTGFQLRFSFHPRSAMLAQHPADGGHWNCSVPHWQQFRDNFPCNLQANCLGREDEAVCSYTTPDCGEGRVSALGRCLVFTIPRRRSHSSTLEPFKVPEVPISWTEAEDWCRKEEGHLVSVRTYSEMTEVADLLFITGGYTVVFIGLVPTTASSSLLYKRRWTHLDGVINHFLELPEEQTGKDGALIDTERKQVVLIVRTVPVPVTTGCLCDLSPTIRSKPSQTLVPSLPSTSVERERYFNDDRSFLGCPDGHMTHVFLACDLQSACWASEAFSASSSSSCSAPVTPLPPEMMCDNNLQHVPYTMVCDHRPDCFDSSDEDFCVFKPCDANKQFECGDKSCVDRLQLCNRKLDCRDGSDEQECAFAPPVNKVVKTQPPVILTLNHDGWLQATEMTRKLTVNGMVVNGTIVNATVTFVNIYGMNRLFYSSVVNNTLVIVDKILEEAWVSIGTLIYRSASSGRDKQVSVTIFKIIVTNGILVSGIKPAESRVLTDVTITGGTVSCPDTHFQCTDDYCVPVFMRCNDVYDCPGREDEADCESYQCPGFYRCRGASVCVHRYDLCDAVVNCPQRDDELLCWITCPDACKCYGLAFFCTHVTHVDFYEQPRYLDVSDSNIRYSDVVNNTMLVYLSLVRCNVTGWGPVTLPNLRSLDLSDNKVTEITSHFLLHLPNLRHLTLAGNPLKAVFTSELLTISRSLTSLQSLDISNVLLPELDLTVLNVFPRLYTLNLTGCGVDRLVGDGFQHLKQLRALDFRGCPMTFFPKGVFHGLRKLRYVHADNYKLCCTATLPTGSLYSVDCKAPMNEVSLCEDLLRSNFLRICLYIFVVFSCAGNLSSLAFKVVSKTKRRTGFDVLVANLCMSDFLMGIYLTIIGVADRSYMGTYLWNDVSWRYSIACTVAGFLSLLSSEVSAFIICLITLDRLLVLSFPFSQHLRFNSVTACIACALVWSTCLVIAAVPLLPGMFQRQFYSQTGICLPLPITRTDFKGREYTFSVMIVLNFVLFVIVALGQLLIYVSVQRHRMPTIGDAPTPSSKKDQKLARRLLTVAVSDFLCWFPVGLLGIMSSHGYRVSGEVNVAIAIFVLPLNSAINPFLYTLNVMLEKVNQSREKRMRQYWLAQMNAQGACSGNVSRLGSKCTQGEAQTILKMWLSRGILSHEHVTLSLKKDDGTDSHSTNKTT